MVALRVNGDGHGPVSAEWMIPKALWLVENEPEIFERAAVICEFQDFINYHLTGRWVASINNASVRWHFDRSRTGVPESLLEKLGLSALAAKWPAEILDLGDVITIGEERPVVRTGLLGLRTAPSDRPRRWAQVTAAQNALVAEVVGSTSFGGTSGATPMTASSGRDLSASDASSCSFWKRSKSLPKRICPAANGRPSQPPNW